MLKTPRKTGIEAGEFARVLAALRAGIDPGRLAREVAFRHPEDHGRISHVRDLASAFLWLGEGVPVADVLTMLECRHRFDLSPSQCQAHAVEILLAVQHEIAPQEDPPILPSKEHEYAAA